ncbi:MAG TPA: hypothetical protein VFV41_26445 [Streptosporangiaceae bacterium]|nr:hypothetical protein [Streptosporangiaceae bacterium]
MLGDRIEQRALLRREQPPGRTTLVVRGGRDSIDKLRSHAQRTARAWSLDGVPLLGISVFAVLDMPLEILLRRRFASFRTIYLPTVSHLNERGFELLATGRRPHFTIRLLRADDRELEKLLAVLGPAGPNPQYAKTDGWREEG